MPIRFVAAKLTLVVAAALWAAAPHAGAQAPAGTRAQAGAAAQSGVAAPGATLADGTAMNAELKSRLDAGKAKPGDKVTAVTTADVKQHGRVVIPKGSTLTGHVTEVSASGRDHQASSLGVVFDQAETKQGAVIPIHAGITSLTSAAAANAGGDDMAMPAPMEMAGGGARAGGGLLGGAAGVTGGLAGGLGGGLNAVGSTAGVAAGGTGSAGGALRTSNGLPLRIQDPVAASASAGASEGTVMSTPKGNLRLDSGTQMQLQTHAAAGGGV